MGLKATSGHAGTVWQPLASGAAQGAQPWDWLVGPTGVVHKCDVTPAWRGAQV